MNGGILGSIFGKSGGSIDLDASCLCFNSKKNLVETVYFGNLKNRNMSIRHSGDNLTGFGSGDDETIHVDLENVPSDVETLIFTVTSFRGQSLGSVKNAHFRLLDNSMKSGVELYRFDINKSLSKTGLVMAKLSRDWGGWSIVAIGDEVNGTTPESLRNIASNYC